VAEGLRNWIFARDVAIVVVVLHKSGVRRWDCGAHTLMSSALVWRAQQLQDRIGCEYECVRERVHRVEPTCPQEEALD
jgi:hypothetical protein